MPKVGRVTKPRQFVSFYFSRRFPSPIPSRLSTLVGWWILVHRCGLPRTLALPILISGSNSSPRAEASCSGRGRTRAPFAGLPWRSYGLRPAGPDRSTVEVFADHFGKLSFGGISFSHDGSKMIITDAGNYAIVILKRTK